MTVRIQITIDCPAWMRVAARAAVPVVAIMSVGLAYGTQKTFTSGSPVSAADMNGNFTELYDRTGDPDCPVGYTRDVDPPNPFNTSSIGCSKGNDQLVKVGTGGSAFWIDKYEASLWMMPSGVTQVFVTADDSTSAFPPNGQITAPLYALSVKNVTPSTRFTWFQAMEACAASGKRLPTGEEWLRAARGTHDPVAANDGSTNAMCMTTGMKRPTGGAIGASQATSCISDWGTEDMIGGINEMTSEWFATVGDTTQSATPWGAAFGNDGTANITSSATDATTAILGLPAIGRRGGSTSYGTSAGVFALLLERSPISTSSGTGMRCVVPR